MLPSTVDKQQQLGTEYGWKILRHQRQFNLRSIYANNCIKNSVKKKKRNGPQALPRQQRTSNPEARGPCCTSIAPAHFKSTRTLTHFSSARASQKLCDPSPRQRRPHISKARGCSTSAAPHIPKAHGPCSTSAVPVHFKISHALLPRQ